MTLGRTQTLPIVTLEVGDTTLVLQYTLRAIRDLFQETGFNILEQGISPEKLADIEFLVALLAHGLKIHQPELTRDWLLDNIGPGNMGDVILALQEAVNIILPKRVLEAVAKQKEGKDPQNPPTSS